jgi:GNAT superfamily N-acetyltransferase
MSEIEVRPIQNAHEKRIFLTFPWQIYRNDPLWVPPLIPERAKLIDPGRGAFFKGGIAEFFIAWKDGKPVGTICAAEDKPTNAARGMHECMFGFFECIDDRAVAEALFKKVIEWAHAQGLDYLHGPFNLDYEDSYGVLLEGRDRPPVLLCGHTPPYYQEFVEAFGFTPARGANIAYAIEVNEDTPAIQRMMRIAERARQQGHITIRSADFKRWDEEIDTVVMLLNECLKHLTDFIPYRRETAQSLFEPFRQIADPELVLFAEAEGKTIGFFPAIPNVNEWLMHANGLRYPWNYLSLWWYSRQTPKCLSIKSVLLLPDYWGSAAAVLLFDEMRRRVVPRGYTWIDLSLTSEDNPKTPMIAERLGCKKYKRYQVYRLSI